MSGRRRRRTRPEKDRLRRLTRAERWGTAAFVAAVLLMIAVLAVVGDLSHERLGPWLRTLGPWRRAGLGAAVGVAAALPALALHWAFRCTAVGVVVCWYLLTALVHFPAVSVPGRGGDGGAAARFREEAGWYALTSPVSYVLTLVLLTAWWLRSYPPEERRPDGRPV